MKLELKGLSYSFPDSESEIVSEFSELFVAGDFVGIVGESGRGKSTFLDLVAGLRTPSSGCISLDGTIVNRNFHAGGNRYGYAGPNSFVFGASLYENVTLNFEGGKDPQRDSRFLKALQLCNLESLFLDEHDRFLQLLGEGGRELSAGQKQRLFLARALYREPDVLILDEATNSLDEQNETEILHRIKEKRSALITFLVAHHFRDFSILTKVLDFQGNGKIISSSL